MSKPVYAFSLWEPWASLMRSGSKTAETRSWSTRYRGPLLICAAKKQDVRSLALLNDPEFQRGLAPLSGGGPAYPSHMSFGKAVALVNLIDCVPTGQARDWLTDEQAFGDYSPGRYAWITENLRTFEPFPVKGAQGLFRFDLPDTLVPLLAKP